MTTASEPRIDLRTQIRPDGAVAVITINNPGPCALTIYSITGSGDFVAPNVQSYPPE